MNTARPTAVLLVNLGTPDAPRTPEVRRYLKQFLSDPRVLDISPVARWLLLNLVILRFRPRKSAQAYRVVWSDRGSPLLYYGEDLRDAVATQLGSDHVVALGMRYGNPSIASAIDSLLAHDPAKLVVLPLFPQYSSAASGSAVQEVLDVVRTRWNVPPLEILDAFYDHPGFINAYATVMREELTDFNADFVLFSYHGLPLRHVMKSWTGEVTCEPRTGPCPAVSRSNRYCYRAQCFATTERLVSALGLEPGGYDTSFQSRLGRTEWIKPYTDEEIPELAKRGIKRLAVVCPAFVTDCLETLEEIGEQAKTQWLELGGEAFKLIPCLNAHPAWVDGVCELVTGGPVTPHPQVSLVPDTPSVRISEAGRSSERSASQS